MKILISVLALCAIMNGAFAEKARFDNYRVYTLQVVTDDHLKVLQHIDDTSDAYSLFRSPVIGRDVDILVPPHKVPDFLEMVERVQFDSVLKNENFQIEVDNEQPAVLPRVLGWNAYGTFEQIMSWMDSMVAQHPSRLTSVTYGTSFEGRPLRALRLSARPGNRAVFIESHIHAREWIASAVATWLLNELLTSTDPQTQQLAETIDWYILPVTNPDGLVHSHNTNRLWRKTRQPHGLICTGADPNRNFNFHWMETGASSNPCAETYAGPSPFSEPETLHLVNYLNGIQGIDMYLSFHSFGNMILLPYGHTQSPSANHVDLMAVAGSGANAITGTFGIPYRFGSISTVLYFAAGGSSDYVFGVSNVPLSFTFEFRDTSTFILPAAQIIPNSVEVWAGIRAMVNEARSRNYL